MNYSPQSSCSIGASCTVAGSRTVTSRSTPQSEHTMISPTSVPAANSIWASHSGQVTVDMIYTPLIFLPLIAFPTKLLKWIGIWISISSSDVFAALCDLVIYRLETRAANRISLLDRFQRVEDFIHIRFKRGTYSLIHFERHFLQRNLLLPRCSDSFSCDRMRFAKWNTFIDQ